MNECCKKCKNCCKKKKPEEEQEEEKDEKKADDKQGIAPSKASQSQRLPKDQKEENMDKRTKARS